MKHPLLLAIGLASSVLTAQEAFVSSASEAQGTGGSVSYSIGQLITASQTTSNTTIDVGIQQPLQIVTLSNPEVTNIQLTAKAYPNPSTDFVVLSLTEASYEELEYALYSINGSLVHQATVTAAETSIDLRRFAVGTYVLRVTQDQKEIKTFKIIKN